MKNKCINCKVEISKYAKRCLQCHLKILNTIQRGKNHLITLCGKCNLEVNTNRDYWFAYFEYIIERSYLWL